MRAVDGMVWEVLVAAPALVDLRERHVITSVSRTAEGVRARMLSADPPWAGVAAVRPNLEDAYLHAIRAAEAPVAAPAWGTGR
jgi:hypothetical protein